MNEENAYTIKIKEAIENKKKNQSLHESILESPNPQVQQQSQTKPQKPQESDSNSPREFILLDDDSSNVDEPNTSPSFIEKPDQNLNIFSKPFTNSMIISSQIKSKYMKMKSADYLKNLVDVKSNGNNI
jgi:hypothetical protein